MRFGNLGKYSILLSAFIIAFANYMPGVNAQEEISSPFKQPATADETSEPVPGHVEKQDVPENNIKKQAPNLVFTSTNSVGVTYAENSINKAGDLIQKNRILEAKAIIEPLTEWLTDATEFHANLYKALKDVDNAKSQADVEKELALKFAILRDKATYNLAMVYIQEKQPQKAVDRLVDVVRSQPRTELGFKAYEKLQNIGFTYKVKLEDAPEAISE